MKSGVFWIQSLVLLAGLMVVAVSLYSANDVSLSLGDTASRRQFYMSSEILPDHLLYPGLMAVDKMALSLAETPSERIRIQVNYAYRRLNSAKSLEQAHKPGLALSTLTKAQKYLNQAAQEALQSGSVADKTVVIRAIAHQNEVVAHLTDQRLSQNPDIIHLRDEAAALQNQLQAGL